MSSSTERATLYPCIRLSPSNTYFFSLLSYSSEAATSRAMRTSSPGIYPADWMASWIKPRASPASFMLGAKPPSSPTAVL